MVDHLPGRYRGCRRRLTGFGRSRRRRVMHWPRRWTLERRCRRRSRRAGSRRMSFATTVSPGPAGALGRSNYWRLACLFTQLRLMWQDATAIRAACDQLAAVAPLHHRQRHGEEAGMEGPRIGATTRAASGTSTQKGNSIVDATRQHPNGTMSLPYPLFAGVVASDDDDGAGAGRAGSSFGYAATWI